MTGVVYNVQPEPVDQQHCRWVSGGNVEFGVEYRSLDPERLRAVFGSNAEDMAEIEANSPEGGFTDEGMSLHVRGADDGHEYLRFDMFDGDPHYHYVWPSGDHNNVVPYDVTANGPMLPWVLERLRTRLADMLGEAQGQGLVAGLDPTAVDRALSEVESTIRALQPG